MDMQADSRWKRFRRRLRYWLDRGERNRSLREEMEFHIQSMIDELVAQGMSKPEARAAAHRDRKSTRLNSSHSSPSRMPSSA